MAVTDSFFLFEFVVEKVKSYVKCKQFSMKIQFSELFTVILKQPVQKYCALKKNKSNDRPKRKQKVRYPKGDGSKALELYSGITSGQSVLLATSEAVLIHSMQHYPMTLHVFSKKSPDYKVGKSELDWDQEYIEFLSELNNDSKTMLPTILQSKSCYVFDENSSRRVACVKLNIKLSYIQNISNTLPSYTSPLSYNAVSISEIPENVEKETGLIKTIYRSKSPVKSRIRYRPLKGGCSTTLRKEVLVASIRSESSISKEIKADSKISFKEIKSQNRMILEDMKQSILSLTRSQTELAPKRRLSLMNSKSCSAMNAKERLEMLKYIFADDKGPFGNKVYYVGYFTVHSDTSKSPDIQSPGKQSPKSSNPTTDDDSKSKTATYKFTKCTDECTKKLEGSGACVQSICSLDLRQEAAPLITVKKCQMIECNDKRFLEPLPPPDDRIYIDFSSLKECCKITEKVEEVVGGMKVKMADTGPCYCTCECTFGYTKRTTYCEICGGYEIIGTNTDEIKAGVMPFPCPIFNNLVDKSKLKSSGTSWSDSKKKGDEMSRVFSKQQQPQPQQHQQQQQRGQSVMVDKRATSADRRALTTDKKSILGDKNGPSSDKKAASAEKRGPLADKRPLSADRRSDQASENASESKKGRKEKKINDDRFKFNYGYQAPHIGHSQCAMPCTGTLDNVPKHMGWLWTADNVPGLKFRPNWKPGSCNKHVVKLLRIAKYPEQEILKRKRREGGKKKRPLKRPLLVVEKHQGEYTVTMETMKMFNKQRMVNQYPYEDKPLVTFTIGRTEEENRIRQKKKERAQRRLEREQREFIQSAFRDMCKDICIKTYRQELGLLPDAEDPECTCYPAQPDPDRTNLEHSCSCSDSLSSFGSDTDDDEWILEFTPPNAFFNQAYKGKKIHTADRDTQYTYLDYRVKLLDRYGNPVPRFFIGPDGKQVCSDLGGFWSRDRKWLEINVDGYVAPDGRWAPLSFIGPSGEQVDTEQGKFQTTTGAWLMVGVDGYVDSKNKWRYYPKPKKAPTPRKVLGKRGAAGDKKLGGAGEKEAAKASEGTWSCLGDASPKHLSRMGIVGHGHDRKLLLATLQKLAAQGEDVKLPQTPSVPFTAHKKPKKKGFDHYYRERTKCHHPMPSAKGLLAVDEHGRKVYFKLKDRLNMRPQERMISLGDQGISLSSFHVPCLSSFIGSEWMKQQQIAHIKEHNARAQNVDTQSDRPPVMTYY